MIVSRGAVIAQALSVTAVLSEGSPENIRPRTPMNKILICPDGSVDLEAAQKAVWEVVAKALTQGGVQVVVFSDGDGDMGVLRQTAQLGDGASTPEGVANYREGYADGYVDCLTIRGSCN
jgi:hypothetical protein